MNRLVALALILAGFLGAPAAAVPLTFGAINGADDFSDDTGVVACDANASRADGARTCALKRTSFGGLPIARSVVSLNTEGNVRSVEIVLDSRDYETARQLLQGRYGRPSADGKGVPQWRRFDDGANIAIRKAGPEAVILFDFPANASAHARAAPESRLAWSLLLFVALGLAAGILLRRRRPDPPRSREGHQAVPPLSMRETLERRLRDREDLSF